MALHIASSDVKPIGTNISERKLKTTSEGVFTTYTSIPIDLHNALISSDNKDFNARLRREASLAVMNVIQAMLKEEFEVSEPIEKSKRILNIKE